MLIGETTTEIVKRVAFAGLQIAPQQSLAVTVAA